MPEKNTSNSEFKLQGWLWCGLFAFWLSVVFGGFLSPLNMETIPYSTFLSYVKQEKLENLKISQQEISGIYKEKQSDTQEFKKKRFKTIRIDDPQLAARLQDQKIEFEGVQEDTLGKTIVSWIIWIVVFFGFWTLLFGSMAGKDGMGMGTGLMSISRNRAKVYMESKVKTTFDDLAGVDEAKEELQEVIGFLKEPQRYSRLGGHLPKGILLVGPPGTGKTLLARAVAGEAGVPFFSISGSEFVELFVGVGAARVRDLFEQAQKNAPCIIFIDELDAVGRARGLNPMGGSHDEKEQTLNQLLVEMDGFDSKQGVILLAATNRPEILDAALLRAGRFDRQVLVDRPDKIGRAQILQIHMKNVSCSNQVNIEDIAAMTPGFTGADLANLVNEAVLLATRRNAASVEPEDFVCALERVVAGLEKKNRLLHPKERKVVAFHEMGHALVAMSVPGSDPIQKVSIIPRGIGALGYTMQRPTDDRYLRTKEELENKLAVLMGGRAAEHIIFREMSTGAADDLVKASEIARDMVTRYGMSAELGPVTYEQAQQPFLGHSGYNESKQFSQETAREIDLCVREIVNRSFERAVAILSSRRGDLEKAAKQLLAKETLSEDELLEILDRQETELNESSLKSASPLTARAQWPAISS